MEWKFFKDKSSMAHDSLKWLKKKCEYRKIESAYIPAGSTPIPLFALIEKEKPNWLEDIKLIQVDDIPEGSDQNLFKEFLHNHLPSYKDNIISPSEKKFHQADVCILGLGENGHIAFHEPHIEDSFKFGLVALSDITLKNLNLPKDTKGLSYGAQAFLATQSILLLISGDSKKDIVEKLLAGRKSPAALLLEHKDITIFCDQSLRPE